MIRIIVDDKVIIAENATELEDRLDEIFPIDPNEDVMLTYVVSRQPTSRRMAPTV